MVNIIIIYTAVLLCALISIPPISNRLCLVSGFSFSRFSRSSIRRSLPLQRSNIITPLEAWNNYPKNHKRRRIRSQNYSVGINARLYSSTTSIEQSVKSTTCKYCNQSFESRNAFFRHVRADNECRTKAMVEAGSVERYDELVKGVFKNAIKRSTVMQVGYMFNTYSKRPNGDNLNASQTAYEVIREVFIRALCQLHGLQGFDIDLEWFNNLVVFTQASAAKLRPIALTQDDDCVAVGDVIAVNYRRDTAKIEDIILKVNEILAEDKTRECGLDIHVLSTEQLPSLSRLHAESACTQRAYHYLIPLTWLPNAEETTEWCISVEQRKRSEAAISSSKKTSRFGAEKRLHTQRSSSPSTMKALKQALKLVTSTTDDGYKKKSAGRFGSLNSKDKICWHNFADPSLEGLASPNNSPVWRSLDRIRTAEIVFASDDPISTRNNVFLAIEMRGDGFLTQMVRRIIGTTIAIVNGWLPDDFFYWATRPDIVIETPIAPMGLAYLAGARFDFNEIILNRALFRSKQNDIKMQRRWVVDLHNSIISNRSMNDENNWLSELEEAISPRIRSQLQNIVLAENKREEKSEWRESLGDSLPSLRTGESLSYRNVLVSLRKIVDAGKWPTTSMARSRIIRKSSDRDMSLVNKSGSFTIVNPYVDHGLGNTLPLGNELFPDLSSAVFGLEKQLCLENGINRPASSHCAINRNAQFTPHVDSGRGFGQSLSMIVGLGNYVGGGLYVEGDLKDIRYHPLEFDGWRLRHWTESFEGERYSLVWFTPEAKRTKLSSQDDSKALSEDKNKHDMNAEEIASRHALDVLPTYPMLEYREKSTDALVISELLDNKKGSVYRFPDQTSCTSQDIDGLAFSPTVHNGVLDIGAHIGVFVRSCLGDGCQRIKAYEPDVENFELLKRNIVPLDEKSPIVVGAYNAAVAQVNGTAVQKFVRGVDQKGVHNTWRGSLASYSHYKTQQDERYEVLVNVVPFFGSNGALESGITLVKLDCEGAEIDILCSDEAADKENWLDVTHLVFEWSFTKDKKVSTFHHALRNLVHSGFNVSYEGQGSFWDVSTDTWPFFTDLVVFATRDPNPSQLE